MVDLGQSYSRPSRLEVNPVAPHVGGSPLEVDGKVLAASGYKGHLDSLGSSLAIEVDLCLALPLTVHDVVLHDVHFDIDRAIDISSGKEPVLGPSGHPQLQLVGVPVVPHQLHRHLLGSRVQVADDLVLNTIDDEHAGDAAAGHTVNLHLPLVVVIKPEGAVQLGHPARLNVHIKEGRRLAVDVVNGHLGLPHAALQLPVEDDLASLGPVGEEGEFLHILVVNLHVKEAVNVIASIEVDVKFNIIKVEAVEELLSRASDMGTATLHQVVGVCVLDPEAESDDAQIKLLVPGALGVPLHPDAQGLRVGQQLLKVVHQVDGGEGGPLGGHHHCQETDQRPHGGAT